VPKSHNATGRSLHKERYLDVPHYLLKSAHYKRLSPTARAAWIDIAALYNGRNNGSLAVGARWLADRLGVGKTCAAAAIRDLITHGFLEIAKASSFSAKRRATEYRLTHLKCDATGKLASRTFMNEPAGNTSDSPPGRTT
jgi:hypothetical protein